MLGWLSEWLPDEIVSQILLKLPVKPLIRFASVSKFWCSHINNPDFINTQISQSSSRPLFLYHIELDQYFVAGFESQDFRNFKFTFKSVRSIGYSNGLVCLFDRRILSNRYEDTFILWNPSIGKSFTLPQPNFTYSSNCECNYNHFIGFGFDSNTNDYKVFRMMFHSFRNCRHIPQIEIENKIQAEIYSFNTNSWKIIAASPTNLLITNRCFAFELCLRRAAFIRNAFHWALTYTDTAGMPPNFRNYILLFDIKKEVFSEIMLPKKEELGEYIRSSPLKVFRDSSIAYVYQENSWHPNTTIWVMEEYGNVESWVKLVELGAVEGIEGRVIVMGFMNDGVAMYKFYRGQSDGNILLTMQM